MIDDASDDAGARASPHELAGSETMALGLRPRTAAVDFLSDLLKHTRCRAPSGTSGTARRQ